METQMEPDSYKGVTHIFNYYMGTPIGQALIKVLDEMKQARVLDDDTEYLIKREFKRSITQAMEEYQEGKECHIEGNPVDFKFIYNVFNIKLQPACVTVDGYQTINIPLLEVTAMRHDN
ncbi:hypothetical protein TVAG_276990 [Trichomonas vaginalis G3]|uniref:Uncharacterized protein n=1 Tax=Trichomonas vaginalis (strain ATCC PRA-98 / G3) TaxID=412133 RepID=A2FP59_TRIV3|nr:transcription factor IIA, alpha-helical domain-containing protein [Trichomonas vaginalis G3]EAX93294.1 hypothetical protein TVAG_276990 [Trichomonas vaginalis G3]KAI5547495.1 transcription factor IIA, alpha-helical domain-containing protein [Trichomonas vaginalis G3]|eukprot:XP_001306224.1 hypothetical protein [Trichomonas vaginalis G3]